MSQITPELEDGTGLTPTLNPADSGGDQVEVKKGDTAVHIWIENTDTNSHTATFASFAANLPPGVSASDVAVNLPAGEITVLTIGGESTSKLLDSNNQTDITYDNATPLNIGAVRRIKT